MRNLKKFLALVMAMVMAFSLMLSASAANPVKTFDDAGNITEQFVEAADVLTGMKVFQGDEGGFRPGDQINRAEVAALIYRLATGDTGNDRKDLYKDYGNFTDVSSTDWFAGYVGYCANAGYIKGKTDTTFDPYAPVTGYEALAMILRAVGYDKNGEFTGPTWQTNVSALSTQLGILKQVKSTHYGDRLYEASRRDVVASLLFESAQIPMVNYTAIGGYNKFVNLVNNELNPSLGYKNFGLTSTTRIVVGNQETGEKATVLGVEVGEGKTIAYTDDQNDARSVSYTEYTYPGTVLVNDRGWRAKRDDGTLITAPAGLNLDLKTGLDLFGHKVKFWYDDTDSGAKTTYAYFDKATVAKTVYAEDASLGADGELLEAAKDAGFAKNNSAVWSDEYSRFDTQKLYRDDNGTAENGLADKASWLSATHAAPNDESQVCMYTLVSNSDNKGVDVVIRENIELAEIRKLNTTSKDQTLTLGDAAVLGGNDNAEDGATDKTGFTNFPDKTDRTPAGSDESVGHAGEILMDNLTEGSVKTLGAIVYATEIRGTNGIDIYQGNELNNNGNRVTLNIKYPEKCLFKLEDPETVETAVSASSWDTTDNTTADEHADDGDVNTIVAANGETYKRSGIARGITVDDTTADGRVINEAITVFNHDNMIYGETLTIYLDKVGRFMGYKRGTDYSFLYGTFADYSFGDLGTGTMQYAITGVDWDGNIVKNHVLTSISTGNSNVAGELVTFRGSSLATAYTMNTGAAGTPNGGSTANQYMLNITKKFLGDQTGTMGNQIKAGPYMGFAINPAGHLVNGIWAAANTYDVVYRDEIFARVAGAVNNDANGEGNWTVTATDARNGFADFGNLADGTAGTGKLLATEDTKFIVVSGTGTDTLSVKTYEGITEFLDGATEVVINNADPTVGTNNGWNYYRTRADRYNNMNTTDNGLIDTVIMNVKNVTRSNASNLYYANKDAKTGTMLDGEYYQYELYTDGVKGYYFIESIDGDPIDPGTDDITLGAFHTLTQTKTVNGQPVYAATTVPNTGATQKDGLYNVNGSYCYTNANAGAVYTYISTSNLSSARIGDGVAANVTGTNAQTYRVDNAKVVDLTGGKSTGDSGVKHNGFNSVADINAAISRGWQCDSNDDGTLEAGLEVAIVNDGVNVTLIYVIGAIAPGETNTP